MTTSFQNTAINRNAVTQIKAHHFIAEASDLRWPPGFFPHQASTDLGNGQPLLLSLIEEDSAVYRQQYGCISVRVFND
jgi:hypothetical protein